MKRLFFIAALGIVLVATHITCRWSQTLHDNGAATGSAVADMQNVFAQREHERVRETQRAIQAVQERREQAARKQRADENAHKAVWTEIARLQQEDAKKQ
jgi:hypothetical protein